MKDISADRHLNLFQFFSESNEKNYIEKNLSRALALCLRHDYTFQYAFLQNILSPDDFEKVFYAYEEDSKVLIDLEKETAQLVEGTATLYAIGLTDSEDRQDWDNIQKDIVKADKKNYTDLVISVKDLRIIIEIKKHNEDCREQLRQQIAPFLEEQTNGIRTQKTIVKTGHLSWSSLVAMLEKINHFYEYNDLRPHFISSFLHMIRTRFADWLPTRSFSHIPFSANNNNQSIHHELSKRLKQSMREIKTYGVEHFWDRSSIKLNKPWATEVQPKFELIDNEPYFTINIWPGNTKQQGYSLYNSALKWVNNISLTVNEKSYTLIVDRHIKFMHFNKYITGINISMRCTDAVLTKEINTKDNHYRHLAGKWERQYWGNFDSIMKEHFKGNWKDECEDDWDSEFANSGRSYFTLSLGYWVQLRIPYATLQALDATMDGYKKTAQFLEDCTNAIVAMIDDNS